MTYVGLQPRLGWTEAAMIAGAREAGVSPSIVGSFPRKEAALVEVYFHFFGMKMPLEFGTIKYSLLTTSLDTETDFVHYLYF